MIDVAIIGGGVMGLAAAWRLAEAGIDVEVFERFTVGNARGSSHGPNRIFRFAYDHPAYVTMAQRSLPYWAELSGAGGDLLRTTGGIDLGNIDALDRCATAMDARGAATEWLEPEAIGERFPWLHAKRRGLFSPDTAVIDAASTVQRLAERAHAAGAVITEGVVVAGLEAGDDQATFDAGGRSVTARRVVVAAGAWANEVLAPIGRSFPARTTREQVLFIAAPAGMVPVVWRGERFFYTVPPVDGGPTIKVGEHVAGRDVDPSTEGEADADALAPTVAWLTEHIPDVTPPVTQIDTCLYTTTPDEHFVLDRRGPVIVCSPCSGHGFKFAPLIGEVVACLATDRQPPIDISLFALGRF